ncbi:MAG: hypothetical protein IT353_06895 [Gemmatimonadaceae bacterium]|nr:hypothetical protein [Gemmatimonadaceae bacterium]
MRHQRPSPENRRLFLKAATVLVAGAACAPGNDATIVSDSPASAPLRDADFPSVQLFALAEAVLPTALGAGGVRAAMTAFVRWCDGYEPVAEEMHGYGYADIRYLPADPVPAWHAQLLGLDTLSQRVHHAPFASRSVAERQALVGQATRSVRGERWPAPLAASHIAIALVGHWAASPNAWDLALGARVAPLTCRALKDGVQKPVPLDNTPTPSASAQS